MKLALLTISLVLSSLTIYAQTINSGNYPMTIYSGISLEDMTSSTNLIGSGQVAFSAPAIEFGNNFSFCLNGVCYDSLVINARGVIRLGTEFSNFFFISYGKPEIAPLGASMSTGTNGYVNYKMMGSFPNRKFVIHWKVNLLSNTPSFPANDVFQLWLHENGRVDFVYENTPTSWNGTFDQRYQNGISYEINPAVERILVDTQIPFSNTIATYGSNAFYNAEVIPDSTMFSFIPDTNLVGAPLSSFGNIGARCVEVLITDTTRNEEFFKVLRSSDGINYNFLVDQIPSVNVDSGTTYSASDKYLTPNTTYYYAVIAQNYSTIPDTTFIDTVTTAPQLFGVKNIPGDYTSISEAVEDIKCREISSNLILELNNSYNDSNEIFPILIDSNVWTDINKQLTIRPALGASNVVISNTSGSAMFIIKSSNYIHIDGRPGGVGNTNELSLINDTTSNYVVHYSDSSRYNDIINCNIKGQGKNDNFANALIYFDSLNNSNNLIQSCYFSPVSNNAWVEFAIRSISDVNSQNTNNTITSCDFENFGSFPFRSYYANNDIGAISAGAGNSDWQIDSCNFFLTDTLVGWSNTLCIDINSRDGENFNILNNWFGGSSPNCAGAKMQVTCGFKYISIITDTGAVSIIQGNRINNIHAEINAFCTQSNEFIDTECQNIIIDNNYIGDTLVNNSITYNKATSQIVPVIPINAKPQLTKVSNFIITNNVIGGIKLTGQTNMTGIKYREISTIKDEVLVSNNIIGGSVDSSIISNSFIGITGINFNGVDSIVIDNNIIRNVFAGIGGSFGILYSYGTSPTLPTNHLGITVSNNSVHHISHIGTETTSFTGISLNLDAGQKLIKNNEIHSINYKVNNDKHVSITGILSNSTSDNQLISHNFIHNLTGNTSRPADIVAGLRAYGNSRIENNFISLGMDEFGAAVIDTQTIHGIIAFASTADSIIINHNSVHLGGNPVAPIVDYGCPIEAGGSSTNPTIVITNNIFSTTRDNRLMDIHPDEVLISDYNLFYGPNIETFNNDFNVWSLLNWVSNWGMDSNSVFREPKFINPDGGSTACDLHLQAANYAESRGVNSNVNIDYDYDNRSSLTPVDIGADAGNYYQLPIVDLGYDTILCSGDSFTLFGGNYSQYVWNTSDTTASITVNSSGQYSVTITDSLGYMSFDSINILVDTSSLTNINISICNTDSALIFGNYQNTPGVYYDSLQNINGCDSIMAVSLSVDTSYLFQDTVSICQGDSVLIYGSFQNLSGNYYDSLQTLSGCDSVLSTTLTTTPTFGFASTVSICNGDSIFLSGAFQTLPGLYTDTLTTINGCDSVISTTLIKLPTFGAASTVSICNGDSIFLSGAFQTLPGLYTDTLTAINGCDSVLSTTLIKLPTFGAASNTSICSGDSIFLGGGFQTTPGLYIDTLSAQQNGCDSIVSTTLLVNPLPNVILLAFSPDTLCDNGSSVPLPPGIPSGGWYSGTGVFGSLYDPNSAGVGTYNITYSYTDNNLCTNSDTTIITVQNCVGVNEIENDFGIIIYPNPNTGLFTIEKPFSLNKEVKIKLLDATSKLIVEKVIPIGKQKVEMDITDYSKGIYYLQLVVGEVIFVKQILKN